MFKEEVKISPFLYTDILESNSGVAVVEKSRLEKQNTV